MSATIELTNVTKTFPGVVALHEVDLALRSFFETPTIRPLAREIERLIIARLESMSEAEALQLLESNFTV